MDAQQVTKIQFLEDAATVLPMLLEVSQKKQAADQALIQATIEATNETASAGRMKRRMIAAVSSRENIAAVQAAPPKPKFGDAPPVSIPYPPLPPLPPNASGGPDGSVTGWNGSGYDEYNASHTGYLNGLTNILIYYNAHPTTASFWSLTRYLNEMAQRGLLNGDVDTIMNLCNGTNLLADGIEHNAEIAFLMGYTDANGRTHGQGMGAYMAYLEDQQAYQSQVMGTSPNGYTQKMLDEVNILIQTSGTFQANHIDRNTGDIIWMYSIPGLGYTGQFDWTTADDSTKFAIEQEILNSGSDGTDPNSDIDNLTAAIGKIQVFDLLNTMDAVWNKYHDVGLLILAFMTTLDGGYLNQESGNADIMDKQHQYDQKYVQQIQSIVSQIGTWVDPTVSGGASTGAASAGTLQEMVPIISVLVQVSGQFTALQGPIQNFIQNLSSTTIKGTLGGTPYTDITLADVLITHEYTDASGGIHEISANDAAILLHDNLTPDPGPYNPLPVPSPTPTPTPNGPNTEALQGFISSISSISGAVSSSSTQLTTATSQVEQMHQAILKMGTYVVDTKEGLASIKNNAVSRQVSQ